MQVPWVMQAQSLLPGCGLGNSGLPARCAQPPAVERAPHLRSDSPPLPCAGFPTVAVDDVAAANVAVMLEPAALGRYLLCERSGLMSDLIKEVG